MRPECDEGACGQGEIGEEEHRIGKPAGPHLSLSDVRQGEEAQEWQILDQRYHLVSFELGLDTERIEDAFPPYLQTQGIVLSDELTVFRATQQVGARVIAKGQYLV